MIQSEPLLPWHVVGSLLCWFQNTDFKEHQESRLCPCALNDVSWVWSANAIITLGFILLPVVVLLNVVRQNWFLDISEMLLVPLAWSETTGVLSLAYVVRRRRARGGSRRSQRACVCLELKAALDPQGQSSPWKKSKKVGCRGGIALHTCIRGG